MYCQNCGHEIKAGVRFCSGCGASIQAGPPPAHQAVPSALQGETVPPYQNAPTAQQPTQIQHQPIQYQSHTTSEKTPFYKKKIFLITAGVLLVLGFISSCMENEETTVPPPKSNVVEYKVIEEKNLDYGVAKRTSFSIVVPQKTTDEQIDATLKAAVKELAKRRDVDALSVNIYFEDTEMPYANATFAPEGEWEKADKDASRDTFEISIQRLSEKRPATKDAGDRFGLDTATRKQVFKEIVAEERKAVNEGIAKYPTPADLDKQLDLENQLKEQYKQALAERYNLTREQLDQIGVEGVTGNWPMD